MRGAVWRWRWCWGQERWEWKYGHLIQQQGSQRRLKNQQRQMWTPGREAGLSELKGEREGKKQRHLLTESLIQTWIHQLSFKQILCELSPGGKRKDQVPALEWLITVYKGRQNGKYLLLCPSSQTFLTQVLLSGGISICWSHRPSQCFHTKVYIKKW